MLVDDKALHLLVNQEFYEPLDHYRANPSDFQEVAQRSLPEGWTTAHGGVWVYCHPPRDESPDQGWKIHVSATIQNSTAVLAAAIPVLVGREVPFKFAADRAILYQLNSKRWPRGGAGKFMTVYPRSTAQCGDLLEALHRVLSGYSGPYILSDRRYRGGSPVYYRYGGFAPTRELDVRGRRALVMRAPDGSVIHDERTPYFRLPEGVTDPFGDPAATPPDQGEPGTLGRGRYKVESVLAFSNSGGVYVAVDRNTDTRVLIKEARPHTSQSPQGTDALWTLKKEHRLLQRLEGTGVAPKPLDFFQDWEHFYLVEELLSGAVLRGSNIIHSLALRTRASHSDAEAFFARFRKVYGRIARALEILHAHRIVFSDMSHYNVIVLPDDDIRFIDFEGAYEEGVDTATLLFTPGFAPPQMLDEGMARMEDDLYGLGGLMMAAMMPVNALLGLNPRAPLHFLQAMERDLGLPNPIAAVIHDLMAPRREDRPTLARVRAVLEADHPVREGRVGTREIDEVDEESLVRRIVDHIESVASFERTDRLFPGDPELFETNPLSIAHGACGVAVALQRITGRGQERIVDWILARRPTGEMYPPGLYIGLSGIAWSLLELGAAAEAVPLLRIAADHPLRWASPDLFHGAAGLGSAQLRFFLATGDEEHLARATEAGDFLLATRTEDEGACWWTSPHDGVSCSLAHGVAGVSLFLLNLYLAGGDERYLEAGRRGLRFIESKGVRNADGALTWRAREHEATVTPYWRWGGTGIGSALLRYRHALGEPTWDGMLDDLRVDADRKYTIFPGRFFGLAGLGDYFLELADFGMDEAEAIRSARKAAAGVLLFRIERSSGIAFPGESLARVSCDYGTGSAGIALFLHRLRTRCASSFMLDELLPRSRGAGSGRESWLSPEDERAAASVNVAAG